MATEAERIALIVELATDDAKDKLGRELAAYKARLALDMAFGNSRRWLGLADRLASSGRAFVEELAIRIRAVATHSNALATYSEAVAHFLADLNHIYQTAWDQGRPFRHGDSPPPALWQDARQSLEKAIRQQQMAFEDRPEGARDMMSKTPQPEKSKAKRGRTKGSGSLATVDAPLLAKMETLIAEGKAFSAEGAAKLVAQEAKGGGTQESRATRLANRFRASEKNS